MQGSDSQECNQGKKERLHWMRSNFQEGWNHGYMMMGNMDQRWMEEKILRGRVYRCIKLIDRLNRQGGSSLMQLDENYSISGENVM